MQLADATPSNSTLLHPALQIELSTQALLRAAGAIAAQAETLAEEIERDPTLVENAPDALRLFAALVRESGQATLTPLSGHA